MAYRSCVVSYRDRDNKFEAKVQAETRNEAVVMALKQWAMDKTTRHRGPHRHAVMHIEATAATKKFAVKLTDVYAWLCNTRTATPEQRKRKEFLQALLNDDRR